eukprot:TRINITY_DN979_c0_g1_i1.p1 TRINITY_DN979_c0_g1~~TRINITY_DN979_c0_g1_i1.p1  ORF type:complete len:153 (-),score=50.76 TRINITY_DN979_c0_g1_i1:191-649(-)
MKLLVLLLLGCCYSVSSFDLGNGGVFNQSPEQKSYWAQRFGSGFLSALSKHQVRQRNERHIASSRRRPLPMTPIFSEANPEKEQEAFFGDFEGRKGRAKMLGIPMPAQIFSVPMKSEDDNGTAESREKNYDMKIVQYVYLNKKGKKSKKHSA